MESKKPDLYGRLYAPGTAAAAVMVAWLLLVVSQTRVLVDAFALLHPDWYWLWWWAAALGFEAAVLAVGLVLAENPCWELWASEVILVGLSVLAGFATAISGQKLDDPLVWVRALAMSAVPVQALTVILAGHRLRHEKTPKRSKALKPVGTTDAPDARPTDTKPRLVLAPVRPDNGTPGRPTDVDLAEFKDTTDRTIRRWRKDSPETLEQAYADYSKSMNGNGTGAV